MKNELVELWVYLSTQPLLWLTVTLVAYLIADAISINFNRHPIANPMPISILLISSLLLISETPFSAYFAGAQFVHFLLGPATVALAVPLFRHLPQVRRALIPMSVALIVGCVAAIASAVLFAQVLGLSHATTLALAPKSASAAIAMGVAEKIMAEPALTAVTPLMNLFGLKNYAARGFAAGLAAHGLGTARAFQVNPLAGTFAGIALGLNGLLTAILVPLLLQFLMK
jgi:putative effector of murein hydrolase